MNTTSYDQGEVQLAQSRFITKVYAWMSIALAITAVVAASVASSAVLTGIILGSKPVFYFFLLAEIGLVWVISGAINRLTAMTATLLFIVYSVMNGLTLSVIFLRYTGASIGTTFFVTGGTFAVMSLYGYTTKRDLTSWGHLLMMALIGLIIGSLVNLFWANSALYWICTYVGILLFVALTAYDTQKIKEMGAGGFESSDGMQKGAIIGALSLYLDFINLFLFILRLLGGKRN